ncbi:MAG: helix-turn-helix domain-containing protein [Xanthobacteraceae bacterium]|nr:helix-turn-helix domain-containing protein [Xanthobacteraceae bacterium]
MGIKRIRAVSRAVAVLRSLHRKPGQTLATLQQSTGLPKATLERILATLEDEHVVWRAMADGSYRNTLNLQHRSIAYRKNHRLAEIAMPHLEALRKRIIWPSDLAVRNGYGMVLLETTRSRAALGLFRDPIGRRINMLYSAMGRAYLAFCPEEERTMLVRHLLRSDAEGRTRTMDFGERQNSLRKVLASVRQCGYAVRDPQFGRSRKSDTPADHLAAIAVPILSDSGVLGCINIVWPNKFDLENRIADLHLPDLQRTAASLAKAAATRDLGT